MSLSLRAGGGFAHFAELLTWLMGYETLCIALFEQRDLLLSHFRLGSRICASRERHPQDALLGEMVRCGEPHLRMDNFIDNNEQENSDDKEKVVITSFRIFYEEAGNLKPHRSTCPLILIGNDNPQYL